MQTCMQTRARGALCSSRVRHRPNHTEHLELGFALGPRGNLRQRGGAAFFAAPHKVDTANPEDGNEFLDLCMQC